MPAPSSSSFSNAPRSSRRRRIRRSELLSFATFVLIAIRRVFYSRDLFETPLSFFNDDNNVNDNGNNNVYRNNVDIDDDSANATIIEVLIVRTMSPSEFSIVIDDIMYVKSFYERNSHKRWMEKSRSQCPTLKEAGYAAKLEPFTNGSQSFPNHLLCNEEEGGKTATENNYLTVRADFMIFARSKEWVQYIKQTMDHPSFNFNNNNNNPVVHEVNVDIRDVSSNPHKVWNWILHATPERLEKYDYVWFIDGDVSLKSLNWQAFWQQVKLMRPKITQASVIGSNPERHATYHNILRFKQDARLMAAEVPIVEVQAPLLETKTWVAYRNLLTNDPMVMNRVKDGGEQCFDMAWCHMAKNNMTGRQGSPPIKNIQWRDSSSKLSLDVNDVTAAADWRGRACVTLYQTPIVHVSKVSRNTKGHVFGVAQEMLCRHFRLDLGVIGKQGLKNVYELFNAPET